MRDEKQKAKHGNFLFPFSISFIYFCKFLNFPKMQQWTIQICSGKGVK